MAAVVGALGCSRLMTPGSLLAAAIVWWPSAYELAVGVHGSLFERRCCACTTGHVQTDVSRIQTLIFMYGMQTRNQCPASLADLVDAGLMSRLRRDPWGRSYHFTCNVASREVEVCSAGPDGAWGSDDDICAEKAAP